jgi:hypothetical protein
MQSYADDSLLAVGEELVDVIKEWSESKTVQVELDLIVEKEKNKVKTELTKVIHHCHYHHHHHHHHHHYYHYYYHHYHHHHHYYYY